MQTKRCIDCHYTFTDYHDRRDHARCDHCAIAHEQASSARDAVDDMSGLSTFVAFEQTLDSMTSDTIDASTPDLSTPDASSSDFGGYGGSDNGFGGGGSDGSW